MAFASPEYDLRRTICTASRLERAVQRVSALLAHKWIFDRIPKYWSCISFSFTTGGRGPTVYLVGAEATDVDATGGNTNAEGGAEQKQESKDIHGSFGRSCNAYVALIGESPVAGGETTFGAHK
jgi:hypothetical protein